MTLNEQLGYGSHDRLLIINADDAGMCHATNEGIKQLLEEKVISSSTVMMPCSWAKEMVLYGVSHPDLDLGVHLTFTSEWAVYKWGPVTRGESVLSLVNEEGYFPTDCLTFEQKAESPEIYKEIINQIEMAKTIGLNPTHLDNHMGSLYGLMTGKDYLELVFDVCKQYELPFRVPRYLDGFGGNLPKEAAQLAEIRARQADEKGVIILDYLHGLPFALKEGETYQSYKEEVKVLLKSLKSGVSEIYLHPSHVTEELKAINPQWKKRGMDFDMFRDPEIQEVLKSEGIKMIHWKDLREAQRNTTRRF